MCLEHSIWAASSSAHKSPNLYLSISLFFSFPGLWPFLGTLFAKGLCYYLSLECPLLLLQLKLSLLIKFWLITSQINPVRISHLSFCYSPLAPSLFCITLITVILYLFSTPSRLSAPQDVLFIFMFLTIASNMGTGDGRCSINIY